MKKRVLVVDDDPDFVALLRFRCLSIGADVIEVSNCCEAINLAQNALVDLICIDADSPSGSGAQFVKMYAEMDAAGMDAVGIVPAIVLTESDDLDAMHACCRLRACYVHKSPTFWTRLKPVLESLLDRSPQLDCSDDTIQSS